MKNNEMVCVDHLHFRYKKSEPLWKDLSLSLEEGKVHTLIGPSGCGKSTLLYLIAGLLKPSEDGQVLLKGELPVKGREKSAVILQDYGLFPWKRVYDNVALGLKLRKVSPEEEQKRVASALAAVGLTGRERDFPRVLSGGQRQRLAVARALVLNPDLLLLDEPFSSLDAMTREDLQDQLKAIMADTQMTMILVTHSIEEAVYLSDHIHMMNPKGEFSSLLGFGVSDRSDPLFFEHTVTLRHSLEKFCQEGK